MWDWSWGQVTEENGMKEEKEGERLTRAQRGKLALPGPPTIGERGESETAP